ncbi:uncharacterized protein LOC123874063 [Maniola jurtina]|uniref:uncharacterized protein LOC123874063 n=1 Tax=Maniola jurtina TaxID=191418 RepID=UPI001E68F58B|nr:uncharacterized protein LOC123874063 [Maniola jurtina]
MHSISLALNPTDEEENVYESVNVGGAEDAEDGAVGGASGAVGGVGAGAALWWWRVAPPCRRHGRASQTLEFNERLALPDARDAQGTVPRARRLLRVVAARGGAALSASCGTIDAAPPCVLLLPRWRAPPLAPAASRSYHLLPESQRAAHQLQRYRGARHACCEADGEEPDEADEAEEDAWRARRRDDTHRPD